MDWLLLLPALAVQVFFCFVMLGMGARDALVGSRFSAGEAWPALWIYSLNP